MDHVSGWIVGAFAAFAVPLALKFARDKILVEGKNLVVKNISAALKADDVSDADVKRFQHDVVLAFVHLAESKLGPGVGAQKKQWVISTIINAFPILKGQEAQLGDFIDTAVKTMNDGLKEGEGGVSPDPKPN